MHRQRSIRRRVASRIFLGVAATVGALAGAVIAVAFFSGTSPAETNTFTAAAVDHITISPSSSTITAGGSQSYTVAAFDVSNNSFGDVTASSTFAISPNGSCTGSGCTANVSGAHTVTATFWGLTATSTLTVNPSTATHVVFAPSPSNSNAAAAFSTQPKVAVEDQFNNVVTGSSASIMLAINTQPATGATLSCASNPLSASSGVASFSGCEITGTAGSYTLAATSAPLTSATSSPFTISTALSVSPSGGTVATPNVTLTGNGYTGGKSITTVTFAGVTLPVTPATPTVAANGSWTATFTVPASSNGAQTITAADDATTPLSASTTFTVNASLTVLPTSGIVGANGVMLTGNGYTAGKSITTVTFSGTTLTVTPAIPSVATNGTWTATFTVPASSHGSQTITAADNATVPASASTSFTVNAALTVVPTSGRMGATVTLTGSGYTAGKSVTNVAFGGSPLTISPATPTVNGTGGWTATFTVPNVSTGAKSVSASDNATSPVTASTTFTVTAAVTQTLIGHTVTTSATVTVPGVATTSGATELILIYSESGASGNAINSITGPFSGTPTQITTQVVAGKASVFAWLASGNATTGPVTINMSKANDVTVVDVVQLSGNNLTTPIAQSTTGSGTGTTATSTLTTPAVGNAEIAFFATTPNTTLTTPSAFAQIDDNSGTNFSGFNAMSVYDGDAQTTATSTVGASQAWATIALEIAHS